MNTAACLKIRPAGMPPGRYKWLPLNLYLLLEQEHLLRMGEGVLVIAVHHDPVEVHPGGHRPMGAVKPVPGHGVETGLLTAFDQRSYLLTQQVVHR